MPDPSGHPLASATHRIEIRGLRALGNHGVPEEERARAQPFELDVDVWTGADEAVSADDLEATVDYGRLVDQAVAVVSGPRRFFLLESLASVVASHLLSFDERIDGVAVTVRKVRPPLPHDVASIGVTATRWRGDGRDLGSTTEGHATRLSHDGLGAYQTPVSSSSQALHDDGAERGGKLARAFIGLGSNLGDRQANLRLGVDMLREHGEVVAVSQVYETSPVGGPPQDPYLNLVVEMRTEATPRQLLARCQELEQAAGRVRTVRFGPRTLDADVLLVGDMRVEEGDLVVPHPRMWERRFVLEPLSELAPDIVSEEARAAASGRVSVIGIL